MHRRTFLQSTLSALASLYCPAVLVTAVQKVERRKKQEYPYWKSQVKPDNGKLTEEMLIKSWEIAVKWTRSNDLSNTC